MKVQIAKMGEPIIGGYNHIVCSDNYINFMDISDNECSEKRNHLSVRPSVRPHNRMSVWKS